MKTRAHPHMNYTFVNINSSANMALTIWGCSDVQGYLLRPFARVYVAHEHSLLEARLPAIVWERSWRSPSGRKRTGRNQAYPCNIFSLVNQPGNDDVTFVIFNPFFSAILQLQHWLLWPRIRTLYILLPHRHPNTGANAVPRNE